MATNDLKWFGNEDGYCIVGTHHHEAADKIHDQLVETDLAGLTDIEEFKAKNLKTPQKLWLRPDWESVDDENIDIRIIPETGERAASETGVPALFYQN